MPDIARHVLLVGGGHAHVAVLADWIERGLPAERATVLTPNPALRYSGMVPGWISGQYDRNAGLVDIAALVRRAGADLVLDSCVSVDAGQRLVTTGKGRSIPFDIASIDTGGVGRARDLLGEDARVIDIRPIDAFVDKFAEWRAAQTGPARICVIGGGAGGVEIAFAIGNMSGDGERHCVSLITGEDGLLPDLSRSVRKKVAEELDRQAIATFGSDAEIIGGVLVAGEQRFEQVDLIIAALGSTAPDWPSASGLACNDEGFIAVDQYQRSSSHPHIFAAGDVAHRTDISVPHSGVHAVHAGPVLAENLRAALAGAEPDGVYRPGGRNLYLISAGNGSAIASFGALAAQGRWVARLKHWIDTRWIKKYARLGGTV